MPKFDPERVADMIGREQITAVGLAPTMCNRLLKVPGLERYDFSSLQTLRKAGSPFSREMAEELIRRVTPNIFQGYASTESGGVTLLKPEDQLAHVGSSGKPRWGVEIQIVDGQRRPLPIGEEGEIRVRGPNVCQGYYKNPDEQNKVFDGDWYHTGDLGRLAPNGHLYVIGRQKDLIKTGSINVAPREVEAAIIGMEAIDDVAVVGVPDQEWGEAVKAYVVRKENRTVSDEDIRAHCKKTLAAYKVPKIIEFTTRIERNALGKVTAEFKERAKAEGRRTGA
jgi:acyl-CoA synthetase (AMP-forming)/AMP-acid ligase II